MSKYISREICICTLGDFIVLPYHCTQAAGTMTQYTTQRYYLTRPGIKLTTFRSGSLQLTDSTTASGGSH